MDSLQWISTIFVHIYWTFIMLQQKYFKKKIFPILFKRPKTVKAYFWRFHRLEPLQNKYYKNSRLLLNFMVFLLDRNLSSKMLKLLFLLKDLSYFSNETNLVHLISKKLSFKIYFKICADICGKPWSKIISSIFWDSESHINHLPKFQTIYINHLCSTSFCTDSSIKNSMEVTLVLVL